MLAITTTFISFISALPEIRLTTLTDTNVKRPEGDMAVSKRTLEQVTKSSYDQACFLYLAANILDCIKSWWLYSLSIVQKEDTSHQVKLQNCYHKIKVLLTNTKWHQSEHDAVAVEANCIGHFRIFYCYNWSCLRAVLCHRSKLWGGAIYSLFSPIGYSMAPPPCLTFLDTALQVTQLRFPYCFHHHSAFLCVALHCIPFSLILQ